MSNQPEPIADEPTEPVEKPKRRRLLRAIKPLAIVLVIVLVEVVAAAMLAPSAQETERLAHDFVAASHGHATTQGEDDSHAEKHDEAHDVREVELGVYNITRYNPKTNTTLAIDFVLYGTVLAHDLTEFQHLYENSQVRIREQVLMSMHAAASTDLTDAGLGLIKRRILERTNRALGQPMVKEILFSKFNFVER